MFPADRSLVRSQQPALQERKDLMDAWQQLGGPLRMALLIADTVLIGGRAQRQVAVPAVRMHGAAGLDAVLDERNQSGCRSVRNVSQPDAADPSAILLGRHYNQRLAGDVATVHALLVAAQIALVDFNQ